MGGNNANLLEEIRKAKKDIALSSEAIKQAHSSFTSHYNTFLSLSEQLEVKFKELDIREAAVEIREREVRDKNQQFQEREKECSSREQRLEVREREASTKLDQWTEAEQRMKKNAAKLSSVIQFNVSGKRFAAPKDRLLKHKGSLFEQMIVSDHPPVVQATVELFIDRNPRYTEHVFDFLLDGTLPLPPTPSEQLAIEKEFEYFKIPWKNNSPVPKENNVPEAVQAWLPNKTFRLIYKATKDGFAAKDFHKHCDNRGPTLSLIRSKDGYLFGGYSFLSWDSSNSYKKELDAGDTFIFTLTNPHNIPPTKYYCHNQYAIYCHSSFGPRFGSGSDISVDHNSNQNNNSYTEFPGSYIDTTGKGKKTFTGALKFTSSEIEVYSVI